MDLRHVPVGIHVGVLVLLASSVLCLAAIVVLRFLRRGGARFGIGPAAALVASIPAALGAGLTTWVFHDTLSAMALVGSGGVAAVAAGSAENLIPLAVGLVCTALLAAAAFLVTAAGSSRVDAAAPGGGWLLPVACLAAAALTGPTAGYVALFVGTVNADLVDSRPIPTLWWLAAGGSAASLAVLLLLAPVAAWRAPRGSSSLGVRLVSLCGSVLVGAGALALAIGVYLEIGGLSASALTAVPYRGTLAVAAREALIGLGFAEADPGALRVVVTRERAYAVDRQPIAPEGLKARLDDLSGRGKRLCVQAPETLAYESVAPVVDAASDGGWTELGLLMEEERPDPCAKAFLVRMPSAVAGDARTDDMLYLVVGLTEEGVELNRQPVDNLGALHVRLADVLSYRRSKMVFLRPLPSVGYGRVLKAAWAMRDAGADPVVMMTDEAVERFVPPPPPPPPPPSY